MKANTFFQNMMSPQEFQVQVALGAITKGFGIVSHGTGFQVQFVNGYIVSVQFGPGTYSSHHETSFNSIKHEPHESASAEIAVINPSHKFVTKECARAIYQDETWSDDVLGYRSPEDLIKIMLWASSQ